MFGSVRDVLDFIRERKIVSLDLKTCDLFGRWRHVTTPAGYVTEEVLMEGFGFDGSSYGFRKVNDSDMVLVPDLASGFVDPFYELPTLSFMCNIHTVDDGEPRFVQDPRGVCERAEKLVTERGLGDKLLLGPEFEFYLFDSAAFHDDMQAAGFSLESRQGGWNAGDPHEGNNGYPMPLKGGYHACLPEDTSAEFRTELVELLGEMGVRVKYHHHEVGGPGQVEIETDFSTAIHMADQSMLIKYAVKNFAHRHGKTATFMPKPMYGAPGNGFHVHFKLMREGMPVFADSKGYAGMSDIALQFITGILVHAKALSAFANPSTNSYKRLVPGYEAPVSTVFATSNRSAAIRIPGYVKAANDKRFEYRAGDATANPYLMFAAMIMAGLDGVKRKLDPKREGVGPIEGNLYDLPDSERAKIGALPTSLGDALTALRNDHEFLLEGGVFSQGLVDTWIQRKTSEELNPVTLRPHPYEFFLSFGC